MNSDILIAAELVLPISTPHKYIDRKGRKKPKEEKHMAKIIRHINRLSCHAPPIPYKDTMSIPNWQTLLATSNMDYPQKSDLLYDLSLTTLSMEWTSNIKAISRKKQQFELYNFKQWEAAEILEAIESRMSIIQSNQTKWINSVLEKLKKNEIIDRLIDTDTDGNTTSFSTF